MQGRLGRWLKFLLALAVSIAFSALFLLSTDLGEVADALASADYLYVVPGLALFVVSVVARAVRWQYMFRPRDIPWPGLLPSLLVGYAGNNLLPLRAGELLRAQHLADRAAVPRMVTFGTFIMERLFDFMVLSTFVLWGVLLSDVSGAYLGLALLLAGGTASGFVVALVLARRPALLSKLTARPWPLVPERIRLELGSLTESFFSGFSCLTSLRRFLIVALMTAVAWGFELSMYWVVSEAFALGAGFITIAFAGAAANVAMSVPSAQGGVGPFQYYAREALLRFDVAGPAAAAYAVALHIFLVAPVSLVGLLVLWRSTLPSSAAKPAVAEGAEQR
ncbi:MAG TPA: lysylphosphatidylglycerol synthase transmembrane domain-containing protein [Dehalococcoidia bacterium]|nr:lysylphosphatidylglycerol synthase transmembrane domain-containing protein [Dehalococcoidia bacterium]